MIDLGTVRPGSTLRIPFSSFDKDDGSSITMTNYAVADILIYKDGSTTERASTAGFTATTDFDSKTGKHLAIIDLADDTTADFFKAGSEYLVAIDAVTVDTVTTGGWIARFRIGYPSALLDTSIATLASQTSFTLTTGPAEDDALNGLHVIIHDKASAVQLTHAVIEDYTGASKTVTLRAAPATTFTVAAGDNISVMTEYVRVDVTHLLGTAWLTPGTAGTPDVNAKLLGGTSQTGRDIGASVLLSSGTGTGQVKLSSGYVAPNWGDVGNPTTTVNLSGTTVNLVNTLTTYTGNTPQTGDAYAQTNSGTFGLAAIKGYVDDIGAAGAGLTAVPWNAAWDAEVQSECDDALAARFTWTVAGNVDANVTNWKGATAPAMTGDAFARLGAPAGASVSVDIAAVKTDTGNLVTRITSTLFTGITSLAEWLGLFAGKQTGNSTARTEVRATGAGGGTYDETTDSQEAARDNMGTAQTGDAYAIVNSGTHGNAALKTLIDAIDDYIDTEVAAVKAKTDNLPAAPAAVGDIPTAAQNAAGLLDLSAGVETGLTPRQALRLMVAAAAGKLSGAATTTIVIRNAVADSKDRITATVDSSGNRSAITLDLT